MFIKEHADNFRKHKEAAIFGQRAKEFDSQRMCACLLGDRRNTSLLFTAGKSWR